MEPAATAAVLAVVLYVFHASLTSPATIVVDLREGDYRVDRLRPYVTAAAKKVTEAFSDLQLNAGSLFVLDRPRNKAGKFVKPPRQEGEGLEADEIAGIVADKCVVLDLGHGEWPAWLPSTPAPPCPLPRRLPPPRPHPPPFARPHHAHARPLQACLLLLPLLLLRLQRQRNVPDRRQWTRLPCCSG